MFFSFLHQQQPLTKSSTLLERQRKEMRNEAWMRDPKTLSVFFFNQAFGWPFSRRRPLLLQSSVENNSISRQREGKRIS